MKAFKIHYVVRSDLSVMDLGYRFHMPSIRCHACGKKWALGSIEYPAFKFDFLNDNEFTDDRVLSVDEFADIQKRIATAAKRPVLVTPGASIGTLSGDAYRKTFDDFAWGRVTVPQISKRARDLLYGDGIDLLTAEVDIRYKGKPVDSHLAIQLDKVPLLTEENRKQWTIDHCAICNDYEQKNRRSIVPDGLMIKRAAWPQGQHLVVVRETLRVIASEEFMESVKKHKLTGLSFVECGRYV